MTHFITSLKTKTIIRTLNLARRLKVVINLPQQITWRAVKSCPCLMIVQWALKEQSKKLVNWKLTLKRVFYLSTSTTGPSKLIMISFLRYRLYANTWKQVTWSWNLKKYEWTHAPILSFLLIRIYDVFIHPLKTYLLKLYYLSRISYQVKVLI